ncbi:MAG TPA: glycosyltransferase family 1 protein [Kiloniellales bacterium]|nr:glycosyltransferase family 1 protein [Kiloniellales bacterium]
MRVALVTDAWFPQINGVVRTLSRVKDELEAMGHRLSVFAPHQFRTLPCPTYPEIRLALLQGGRLRRRLGEDRPQAIHIATEGPLGMAARRFCLSRRLPFTTSYHTRFPEYVSARFPVPTSWGYRVMRWFHRPSAGVMVATASLRDELAGRGFGNLKAWSRGVDLALFRPRPDEPPPYDLPRPVFLFVGRVAVEKNIEAFLKLDLPGSKLVVGDGPQLAELRRRYPEARFAGAKVGEALARHYAAADVFVFPSLTDTFGLVLLEALASGLPVAAYPVTGPKDVIGAEPGVGVLDEDLGKAARAALSLDRTRARAYAERFSWRATAELFLANLRPFA